MLESGNSKAVETLSVGKEFIVWAEQYWKFKEAFETTSDEETENCPYDYISMTFANKIDQIIKSRL